MSKVDVILLLKELMKHREWRSIFGSVGKGFVVEYVQRQSSFLGFVYREVFFFVLLFLNGRTELLCALEVRGIVQRRKECSVLLSF